MNDTKWNPETVAAALAECAVDEEEATMQRVAAETGWPIIDGCLVPEGFGPRIYTETGDAIRLERAERRLPPVEVAA